MARILITGGAGFIGSHLTRRLCGLGHDVAVLDAFRPYALPTKPRDQSLRRALIAGAELHAIDLLDNDRVINCLTAFKPELVINLAADPIVGSADSNPLRCKRDIVESIQGLSKAILATRCVQRLVQVSSSMVYGDFVDGRADEMSPTEPVNAYGRVKLAAETIVQNLGLRSDIETVIVRPMAVYGPGDHYDRVVPKFCSQCLSGDPLVIHAGTASLIDFSYVDDIVEGLILAATTPEAAGEIFNLSFGQARTLVELVAILQTHFPDLKHDVAPAVGPARPNRGALDISKARRLLGYRSVTTLEAGIVHCINHLVDRGGAMPDALSGLAG